MLNVFLIEFKKIFSQKKTFVIFIVFILMILTTLRVDLIDYEHRISDGLKETGAMEGSTQSLETIKIRLADPNMTKDEKAKYNIYLDNIEEELSNFKILQNKNTDDMVKIKAKIDTIKSYIFQISEGKLYSYPIVELNKELRFLQYLYDNKIPECTVRHNSFKFIFNFVYTYYPLIFLLLVTLLASDIVTKEIEESTIKLILIQPISRFKIITGKYLALAASVITITIPTFLISFILIGLKDGVGNPSYPFTSNMKYSFDTFSATYISGSERYIPASTLLIKTILFFLLLSLVAASISFMISVLSNTSTMSMSIGIIINIGLAYMVFGTSLLKNCSQYIYISYYNTYDVFSGKINATLNNSQISPLLGVIQMVLIIIITYGVSCMVFTRKDI